MAFPEDDRALRLFPYPGERIADCVESERYYIWAKEHGEILFNGVGLTITVDIEKFVRLQLLVLLSCYLNGCLWSPAEGLATSLPIVFLNLSGARMSSTDENGAW